MARCMAGWLLGLSVASTVGCANLYPAAVRPARSYFAIEYRVRPEGEPRGLTDVHQAEKFAGVRSTWTKAVVRPPETCGADGASCAAWLTEIERGLVDAKLAVASWSAVRDAERAKGEAGYGAAREIGVDVVFVVNGAALETVAFGPRVRESFEVFELGEDGRVGGRLALPDGELDASTAFVKAHVSDARKELAKVPSHLVATLDVTAIDTSSGEAVWFYRKREVAALPLRRQGRRFAFAREGAESWPVSPRGLPAVEKEADAQEFEGPASGALVDRSQALSRTVVADFLSRLRGG